MRILLCAMLALVLTACGNAGGKVHSAATVAATVADAAWAKPPAPLASTAFDEKALTLMAKAVDTAALSASALVRMKAIEPGSPRAIALATALDKARDAVNAAASARKAGSAASYTEALANAEAAFTQIRQIFGE